VETRADCKRTFERIFEESRDPAYIVDPAADRVLAANRAGCAMLGYTHEEMLTTPVSRVHPADLPLLRNFLKRVHRDGQGSTIQLTCRTKDGTFLPTEITLIPLDGGERAYLLGLVQDRSQHRQPDPGA
jgi:PAS domain S-box-containing protein